MSQIAAQISSANTLVSTTVAEVVGQRIRVHSVSGGFVPAPAAPVHVSLLFGGVTVGRWPVHTVTHVPFPVELHANIGDGTNAGSVGVSLGAGGDGVVGYVALTYTRIP